MVSAFRQVFSENRLQHLLPEISMLLKIEFNNTGRITDLSFSLNKMNTITIEELEKLGTIIENTVTIKIPDKDRTNEGYGPFAQVVKFQRLLNNNL